ncbi:hypothetical protein DFS34DRAFT_652373 [Phlyctochytrium arcticum]|nr:hypothetical protein DFS34DRAFT_652373 [Phlyctochytrium arcticum]
MEAARRVTVAGAAMRRVFPNWAWKPIAYVTQLDARLSHNIPKDLLPASRVVTSSDRLCVFVEGELDSLRLLATSLDNGVLSRKAQPPKKVGHLKRRKDRHYVDIHHEGRIFNYAVARIILTSVDPMGPWDVKGMEVDHIDGDRKNDHLDNLQWLTTSEHNMAQKSMASWVVVERVKQGLGPMWVERRSDWDI